MLKMSSLLGYRMHLGSLSLYSLEGDPKANSSPYNDEDPPVTLLAP